MSECALSVKQNADGSCLTQEQVSLITKYSEENTLAEIKKKTNCSDDKCVLDKVNIPNEVKRKIEREAFKAPTASFDHNHWLNNTEIDTIMSQLRCKYPGFAHGFIHMIDLKAFSPANIESFDYPVFSTSQTDFPNEIKAGLIKRGMIQDDSFSYEPKLSTWNNVPLKSYGIVCNTDSSKGSGQHWFALFISTDQKDPNNTSKPWIRIECFNSAGGGSTDKNFNDYWNTQAMNIARSTGLRCSYDVITNIQHQSSSTGNCGSYSLFYIYSRLNGILPSEFNNPKKTIKDYSMQKFRKVCFQIDEENSLF